jgi:hypothetical protein
MKGMIIDVDNEWTFDIQSEFNEYSFKKALVSLFEKGIDK